MLDVKNLLLLTMQNHASDLHLTTNSYPVLRIDGELLLREELEVLDREKLKNLIYSILTNSQKEKFEKDKELDFSFTASSLDRFRVNIHFQRGNVEAAFRRVPIEIPNITDLGLPQIAEELARKPNGLVLVTGPTGMGKSTTLAAVLNLINHERKCMIVTIEDPIEFVFN